MDRGAWRATVHGVAKSWTRLSDFIFTFTTLSNIYHVFGIYCVPVSGYLLFHTLSQQIILKSWRHDLWSQLIHCPLLVTGNTYTLELFQSS